MQENDFKIDAIIQARMGASRLPGKVLLPLFDEKTVLEVLIDNLASSQFITDIIIATSTQEQDDAIALLAEKKGWNCFRGSEENVLNRFFDAARQFGSEIIIRIGADSPFTNVKEMDRLISILIEEKYDYVRNHASNLPIGTGAEVFTFDALKTTEENAKESYEREHVTPYIYEAKNQFNWSDIDPEQAIPDYDTMRLTLDTQEDYELLKKVSDACSVQGLVPSFDNALSAMHQNPQWRKINKSVKQKKYNG